MSSMNKRQDLLAKYLSDVSKIFLTAAVVKQFVGERFNPHELAIVLVTAALLFVIAYFVQPKE